MKFGVTMSTRSISGEATVFCQSVEKVRTFDKAAEAELVKSRDYEGLERMVIEHLLGVK